MQISENPKPIPDDIREKLENYRTQLLAAGFLEPTRHHSADWRWYFHRPDTDLTAFAVNLWGKDGYIEITYGLASTAFTRMAGDENALNWYGLSDTNITLRENFLVCDDADAETLATQIAAFFSRYRGTEKDALLDLAREKRKAYIAQFAAALKPLGFKKKATTWTRPLDSFELIFNLQKSAYADEYYYNIRFQPAGSRDYRRCHESRITPGPLDWQALTARELDFFLNRTLLPTLQKFLETPLSELGRDPKIWKCCHCDHFLCPRCWVEKNVWEAK